MREVIGFHQKLRQVRDNGKEPIESYNERDGVIHLWAIRSYEELTADDLECMIVAAAMDKDAGQLLVFFRRNSERDLVVQLKYLRDKLSEDYFKSDFVQINPSQNYISIPLFNSDDGAVLKQRTTN